MEQMWLSGLRLARQWNLERASPRREKKYRQVITKLPFVLTDAWVLGLFSRFSQVLYSSFSFTCYCLAAKKGSRSIH